MYNDELRIKDRLEEILESIELIQEYLYYIYTLFLLFTASPKTKAMQ